MRFEAVAHAARLYVETRLGKVLVWDATAPNSWAHLMHHLQQKNLVAAEIE